MSNKFEEGRPTQYLDEDPFSGVLYEETPFVKRKDNEFTESNSANAQDSAPSEPVWHGTAGYNLFENGKQTSNLSNYSSPKILI